MNKPNIIFILIDDMGWKDLGCYGSSFYETPHIDKLASEGMLFTDAYAACPVCSPTRASILTGKYPARVGVTQFIGGHTVGRLEDVPYFHQLPMSERSLAQTLKDHGYATWHVGKWHLGNSPTSPTDHGFDINIAGCDWGMPQNGYFSPWNIETLENGEDGEYLTDRLTDESIRLIKEADADQPFFLNLWHYAVHTPIESPDPLIQKYEKKAALLGLDKENPLEEGENFPCQHKKHLKVQRRKFQSDPAYAAMVENLDQNIGRLMNALEESGQADNTLIIFTSDNGGLSTAEGSPTSNAPLHEGKGWMYEGGTREPLIIKWPHNVPAGSRSSTPLTSTDFYPTLPEAAGIDPLPHQHVDGKSFIPLFNSEPLERGPLFWHYPHYSNQGDTPGCSIRDGDWKLIHFFEDDRLELYHLANDLSETTNLAETEPKKTKELKQKLDDWKISVGALIPKKNVNYIP
ncbi:MAG: sulfatase [Opitutaceae bacterium]|nr:sulfatase [Opitutaceae bacterium]